MRNQQLVRREGTGIVLVDIGLGAKERHLKAERLTVLGGQPTGDIPPLRAKLRVTAMIRRKYQPLTGGYGRIRGRHRIRATTCRASADTNAGAHADASADEQAGSPLRARCPHGATNPRARPARHPDSSRRVRSKWR